MKKRYFIAGTDTGCGKTLVSAALLTRANEKSLSTLGLKPVASGAEQTADGLRNNDAVMLQNASSVKLPYAQVNPLVFADAVAPHLAAAKAGRRISINTLAGYLRGAMTTPHDFLVVEGAGGWRVPVSDREFLSALPAELGLEVILVVGMKLGCINHAILTAETIRQDGLVLAGWVASCVDPQMALVEENLATLRRWLPAPCLGVIPYRENITVEEAAGFLELPGKF